MTERICMCMGPTPPEILVMWRRRVDPILRRLMAHGHRVNTKHLGETALLVMLIELDLPETTSKENWNRSHHFTSCPCSPRRTPFNVAFPPEPAIDTVSTEAECLSS